jgi:endonuclease YncB( thermonuclease family)
MRFALTVILLLAAVPAGAGARVIDGDTFDLDGERVRIANIDAPELRHGKCDAEKRLARLAKRRLADLLAAGVIAVVPGDPEDGRRRDRYGRLLAIVTLDGADIGAILVEEELARPWTGHREPWCGSGGR